MLPTELIAWLELEISETGPNNKAHMAWSEENPIKRYIKNGADAKTVERAHEYWKQSRSFASALGLLPGQNGIVINGRVSSDTPWQRVRMLTQACSGSRSCDRQIVRLLGLSKFI